jgi:hypothetical protein
VLYSLCSIPRHPFRCIVIVWSTGNKKTALGCTPLDVNFLRLIPFRGEAHSKAVFLVRRPIQQYELIIYYFLFLRNSGQIDCQVSGKISFLVILPSDNRSSSAAKNIILSTGIPLVFHCDTAGKLTPQSFATLDVPPNK